MEEYTGITRNESGIQPVANLLPNWKVPKDAVVADFKRFKYGAEDDNAIVIHPIMGSVRVKEIKDAEKNDEITPRFINGQWVWFIKKQGVIAQSGGVKNGYSYEKGDYIGVPKAMNDRKQKERDEDDKKFGREVAEKIEAEAIDSLVEEEDKWVGELDL
jgi:hypothetical protein